MISLPLVFVMLFCSSCMPRTEHIQSRLSELDDLVYSNPSYVLHSLSEIDINSIHHKRHKAKHALLHAIALDKTYKDIENDSIIKPALEYYSKHGPSLDRLSMCVRSESAGVNLAPDSKLPVDPDRSFVEGLLMPLQPLSNQTSIETPLSYQYLLITNGGALLGD